MRVLRVCGDVRVSICLLPNAVMPLGTVGIAIAMKRGEQKGSKRTLIRAAIRDGGDGRAFAAFAAFAAWVQKQTYDCHAEFC